MVSKKDSLNTLVNAANRRKTKTNPTTHVIFVLDRSSSMSSLRREAYKSFTEQREGIEEAARDNDQDVHVSTILFNDRVDSPITQTLVEYDYRPAGMTALLDAIGTAIDYGRRSPKGESVLISVITDGGENDSRQESVRSIQEKLGQELAKSNFTIIANGPPGSKPYLQNLGIPVFNIREWEVSREGLEQLTVANNTGYATRMSLQAKTGQLSTRTFYADPDKIDPKDLKDVSKDYLRWRVKSNGIEVADFVRSQGQQYSVGRAFYQLTKPEKVGFNKELLIKDKKTGAIYAGEQARRKLGIPSGQDVRLKPGSQNEYDLFVQSMSYNRKLVDGTTVLFKA